MFASAEMYNSRVIVLKFSDQIQNKFLMMLIYI